MVGSVRFGFVSLFLGKESCSIFFFLVMVVRGCVKFVVKQTKDKTDKQKDKTDRQKKQTDRQNRHTNRKTERHTARETDSNRRARGRGPGAGEGGGRRQRETNSEARRHGRKLTFCFY